jgi:P-type E1-E2 ATPase
MAQSVASTAAKASYTQTMSPSVLTPPPLLPVKKDPKLANNWKSKPAEQLTDAEVMAMPDTEYMNDKQMAFFRQKLMQLKPTTAMIEKDGKELEVPLDEVAVGDIVIVRPGSAYPVDGIVTDGVSTADESILTGESLPVEKQPDSDVTGGAINGEGLIKFRATRVGNDTALSKIIKLVEDAQGKKAPIAKLADIVSGWFVPVVLIIAIMQEMPVAHQGIFLSPSMNASVFLEFLAKRLPTEIMATRKHEMKM